MGDRWAERKVTPRVTSPSSPRRREGKRQRSTPPEQKQHERKLSSLRRQINPRHGPRAGHAQEKQEERPPGSIAHDELLVLRHRRQRARRGPLRKRRRRRGELERP